MLDFAVIAMPRSGTAWASVFLSDGTTCQHDPLAYTTIEELAKRSGGGVSCTALWLHPEFIYKNIKRWVIIEENPEAISNYADKNNLQNIPPEGFELFRTLRGPRIQMADLFHPSTAKDIFEYLRPDQEFDAHKHAALCQLRITSRLCDE